MLGREYITVSKRDSQRAFKASEGALTQEKTADSSANSSYYLWNDYLIPVTLLSF